MAHISTLTIVDPPGSEHELDITVCSANGWRSKAYTYSFTHVTTADGDMWSTLVNACKAIIAHDSRRDKRPLIEKTDKR